MKFPLHGWNLAEPPPRDTGPCDGTTALQSGCQKPRAGLSPSPQPWQQAAPACEDGPAEGETQGHFPAACREVLAAAEW